MERTYWGEMMVRGKGQRSRGLRESYYLVMVVWPLCRREEREESWIRSLRLQCSVKKVSGPMGSLPAKVAYQCNSFPEPSLRSLPCSVIHCLGAAQGMHGLSVNRVGDSEQHRGCQSIILTPAGDLNDIFSWPPRKISQTLNLSTINDKYQL